MKKYESRKEVPEKYKWDLTEFYKNEKDFKSNYEKAVNDVKSLEKYVGCTKNKNKLYEYLNKDTTVCGTSYKVPEYVPSVTIDDEIYAPTYSWLLTLLIKTTEKVAIKMVDRPIILFR